MGLMKGAFPMFPRTHFQLDCFRMMAVLTAMAGGCGSLGSEASPPDGSVASATSPASSSTDRDGDGVLDSVDNCSEVPNPAQRDADSDRYGNFCDADFNNDGATDFLDLGYLKSVFHTSDPVADLNGDGTVDELDLALLKSMFFAPPGPGAVLDAGPPVAPGEILLTTLSPTLDSCGPGMLEFKVNVYAGEGVDGPIALAVEQFAPDSGFSVEIDRNPILAPAQATVRVAIGPWVEDGSHFFRVVGSLGEVESPILWLATMVWSDVPNVTQIDSPTEGQTYVSATPELRWSWDGALGSFPWHSDLFPVEISKDPSFETLEFSLAASSRSYRLPVLLDPNTTYYWRVRVQNACGQTDYVSSSFVTGEGSSFARHEAFCSASRPDGTAQSEIFVPAGAVIDDLDVYVRGSLDMPGGVFTPVLVLHHEQTGGPASPVTAVTLQRSTPSPSSSNVDVIYDDELGWGYWLGPSYPYGPLNSGRIQSDVQLTEFNGESVAGTWTLQSSPGSSIEEWCLVPTRPSFSLEAWPPFWNEACVGGSLDIPVRISRDRDSEGNRTDAEVALSVVNLSSGLSAAFSSNPLVGEEHQSIMTIGAPSPTAVGRHRFDVIGMSPGLPTKQDSVAIRVTDVPPVPVDVASIEPPNGAIHQGGSLYLQWGGHANTYRAELGRDPSFVTYDHSDEGEQYHNTWYPPALLPNTTYYWRVRLDNSCGSTWSEAFSFTIP